MDRRTGEVSRIGAPLIWWHENISKGDLLHAFVGYGPSASRISATIGVGNAAAKYQFMLTTNSISMMLWDLGLVGTGMFVWLFTYSLIKVTRSASRTQNVALKVKLEATGTGLLCIIICLMYNQNAVDVAVIQVLWASLVAVAAGTYDRDTVVPLTQTRIKHRRFSV
jgi:hypothetical protein